MQPEKPPNSLKNREKGRLEPIFPVETLQLERPGCKGDTPI